MCSCLGKRAQAAEVAWGRGATPFWVSPAGKPETTALLNLSCKQQKQFWLLWKDENICKKKKIPMHIFLHFFLLPWKCLNATGKTKKTKRKRKLLWYPSFLPPAVSLWQAYPLGQSLTPLPWGLLFNVQSALDVHWPQSLSNLNTTGISAVSHTNSFPISPTLSTYTSSAEGWHNAYKNTPRPEQLNSITILGY